VRIAHELSPAISGASSAAKHDALQPVCARHASRSLLTAAGQCPTMDDMPPPAVTVDVRLGARLGPGRRSMRLPDGATVADLLAALAPDLGRSPDELAGVAVAVEGEVVGRERMLRDGDALALILPVAGG
jgi:sulfur carrier protein ThiS